eukprot:12633014-Prorocentrum_lima.AAC.1
MVDHILGPDADKDFGEAIVVDLKLALGVGGLVAHGLDDLDEVPVAVDIYEIVHVLELVDVPGML